jgi:hypothetical protein
MKLLSKTYFDLSLRCFVILEPAVLSVKVSLFLRRELNLMIDREYFCTDSTVMLGYINKEARRFLMFVANHVQIIRQDIRTSSVVLHRVRQH